MTTFFAGALELVDDTPGEFCPHDMPGTFRATKGPGWSHCFQSHEGARDGECIRCGLRFTAFMRAVPLRTYRDALTGRPVRQATWAYTHNGGGHDLVRQRILGEREKEGR